MPLVNIKVLKEDQLSAETKAALIRNVTQAIADTLGKDPAATWCIIDEHSTDNWGIGGQTITDKRKNTES
jgi:4-oxalocrotonate tautomerase